MKTVRIETFGCKVNQYESEYMAEQLEKAGYVVLPDGDVSYYIVNSCAVTKEVEKKVKRLIKSIRNRNRNAKSSSPVVLPSFLRMRQGIFRWTWFWESMRKNT